MHGWDKVESVRTDKRWILETENGARYTGVLVPRRWERTTCGSWWRDTIPIRRIDIVEMLRLRNKFIARIDGNLNVGLSYQKGERPRPGSRSTGGPPTEHPFPAHPGVRLDPKRPERRCPAAPKQDLHLQLERTLRRRWSLGVAVGPEQNIQLGTGTEVVRHRLPGQ